MSIANDSKLLLVVKELADSLNCELDMDTLKVLVELLELGLTPEVLARTVKDLQARKESSSKTETRGQ